ncbi:hypothetical protein QF117_09210 [Vibrio sp. YMD68]|uniref:hypothetical protein n=1 Tax=Vibrio sp. YMD68 TaxID=3042300 RepID=UPI00249A4B82|nr:hypothetical protein [Vibrio sp. YMD68]WGW00339.1 hypothetical protein QF117_21165 [Vibrio sp. YMD68]WGW00980.1 hypothetical protein QF117_09210 [Vibrio sp. YMD68]
MSKSLSVLLIEHQRHITTRQEAEQRLAQTLSGLNFDLSGGLMAKVKAVTTAGSELEPVISVVGTYLEAVSAERDSANALIILFAKDKLEVS